MWKLKGYTVDAFDQTQVVYNIWANTKNDLPSTMTDIGYGTALGFGSTAQTFDDSKEWRWNGTDWVEQNSGQEIEISADDIVYDNTSSGMTATNVQDAIDELHDTDETQDNALVELYGEDANQQLEIDYAINTGVKNLLKYDGRSSASTEGVTYTLNADGTITVNGTPQGTGPSFIQLTLNGNAVQVEEFCDGQHILSGCPAGGSDSTYRLYVARGSYSRFDYGDGVLLTETTQTDVRVVVYIANGYTANNLVFSPMIRSADIRNSTFEPYAPTNRELYETKTEQTETNVIANLGAKNMLYISNSPGYTATSHGRTFTVLSDGGIKITGASSDSSNADFYIIGSWSNRSILLNENRDSCLIRMKCDTDYGYNQIRLRAMNRSTGSTVNETGVETNKDVQLSHVITTVFVSVFPSVTLPEDGIVIYPMIRRAEITDSTYVPYAPTNRELYEMILALQSSRSTQSVNSLSKLDVNRNDLNEALDSNFDLIDSIPEEEEGELE